MMVPSKYEIWSVGLRNKMSCPGERLDRGQALYLLSWWVFCWVF